VIRDPDDRHDQLMFKVIGACKRKVGGRGAHKKGNRAAV